MEKCWRSAGDLLSEKICRVTVGAFVLAALAYLLPCAAKADTYYVSKTATGAVHDGRSWQTAFNELNQVPFLYSGDQVEIDGGASSMRYDTPLTIRVQRSSPGGQVIVRSSSAPGRNGQVVIVGNGTGTGIDIDMPFTGPTVHVVGRTWKSIRALNFAIGARVTGFANLSNLQLDNNKECGLIASGYSHTFNQLMINDNAVNVRQRHPGGLFDPGISLKRCWIFNSDANAYKFDGILIENTGIVHGARIQGVKSTYMQGCVMGPGLRNSFVDRGSIDSAYHHLNLTNCLLINPSEANFATEKVQISLNYVTSFLTPLNVSGKAHSCLRAYADDTVVNNSIFYGGVVTAMAKGAVFQPNERPTSTVFRRFGAGNVQFRTSGNVLVLSPSQINPQFVTNVAGIGSAAMPGHLYGLNLQHTVAPTAGSRLISIGQLLSKNYP